MKWEFDLSALLLLGFTAISDGLSLFPWNLKVVHTRNFFSLSRSNNLFSSRLHFSPSNSFNPRVKAGIHLCGPIIAARLCRFKGNEGDLHFSRNATIVAWTLFTVHSYARESFFRVIIRSSHAGRQFRLRSCHFSWQTKDIWQKRQKCSLSLLRNTSFYHRRRLGLSWFTRNDLHTQLCPSQNGNEFPRSFGIVLTRKRFFFG